VGYGLGIDVGTRTVVVAVRQGDDLRILNQAVEPPGRSDLDREVRRQAFAIRRALHCAAEADGTAAQTVVLTYPAGSGRPGFELARRAARQARIADSYLVSDIEAAATFHAMAGRCTEGDLLAAVDLGDVDHTVRPENAPIGSGTGEAGGGSAPEGADPALSGSSPDHSSPDHSSPDHSGADRSIPAEGEVTVSLLRVARFGARLMAPAQTVPVVQSAPAMHAAVSTALRSLLLSVGLEPGQVTGLLLAGEGVLAPGATGRLAERLVEHLGPALGVSSTLMTSPAQAAALGAAAISIRPEIFDEDEDLPSPMVLAGRPVRATDQVFPVRLGRSPVGSGHNRRWVGAVAACAAAVAVGAGAFAVNSRSAGANAAAGDPAARDLRIPATAGSDAPAGSDPVPTSPVPGVHALARPLSAVYGTTIPPSISASGPTGSTRTGTVTDAAPTGSAPTSWSSTTTFTPPSTSSGATGSPGLPDTSSSSPTSSTSTQSSSTSSTTTPGHPGQPRRTRTHRPGGGGGGDGDDGGDDRPHRSGRDGSGRDGSGRSGTGQSGTGQSGTGQSGTGHARSGGRASGPSGRRDG